MMVRDPVLDGIDDHVAVGCPHPEGAFHKTEGDDIGDLLIVGERRFPGNERFRVPLFDLAGAGRPTPLMA